MGTRAFSLIELMVVIAIVAVLSAVAVPAYKNYSIKSKIVAISNPVMDKFKTDVLKYYAEKGVFPQAADLGIGTGQDVSNPSNYGPFTVLRIAAVGTKCALIITGIPGSAVGGTFPETFGYFTAQGDNGLVYTNFIYDDGSGAVKSACGLISGSTTAMYDFLPSNCIYGINSVGGTIFTGGTFFNCT